MRRLIPIAMLLVAAAAPAPVSIGGQAFAYADIVDGRATFDSSGAPAILLTFTPAAAKRMLAASAANRGKPIAIRVNGTPLDTPLIAGPVDGDAVQLSGAPTLDAARTMARRISGKAPLPESLDE